MDESGLVHLWYPVIGNCVSVPYSRVRIGAYLVFCVAMIALGVAGLVFGGPVTAGATLAAIGSALSLGMLRLLSLPGRVLVGDLGYQAFPGGKGPVRWDDVVSVSVTTESLIPNPPLIGRLWRRGSVRVGLLPPPELADFARLNTLQRIQLLNRSGRFLDMTLASMATEEVAKLMQTRLAIYRETHPTARTNPFWPST